MKTKMSIIIALFVAFAIGGCNYSQHKEKKANKKEVIKIGAILPLTGKLAVMGEYERNAMSLAQKDVNKGHGEKIRIIFEDSKSDAKDGVSAANKLLDINKVDFIISSTTGVSLAVKPVVLKAKKNLIAFCMDPNIANDSYDVSRFYIGINEETKGVLSYFKNVSTDTIKVGILYAKVAAIEKAVEDGYLPFFKMNNISVPFVEAYNLTNKNFTNLVVRMKSLNINHLIILGYGFDYPNIYKSLIEQKLLNKLQVLGGWGFLYTSVPKAELEGTLVSGPLYLFEAKDKAKKFIEAYRKAYNIDPNFDAAFAYETIREISKIINPSNVDKPFTPILSKIDSIHGIIGWYKFDKYGNMIVKTGLGRITNGKLMANEQ